MDIVKISSCSIILGLALPYFMTNDKDDENIEYRFQINRTPVRINNAFKDLKKLQDQTTYSLLGAVSGLLIGKFI